MHDDPSYIPRLPEHPELREIALAIESAGISGEILDASFRCVFFSSESARILGLSADEANSVTGRSLIVRSLRGDAEIMRVTEESGAAWWQHNAPIMRRYLEPGDPDFDEVFGPAAPAAAAVEPMEVAPRAWHDTVAFRSNLRLRRNVLGDVSQLQVRINDDTRSFLGVLHLSRGALPQSLQQRLSRGDPRLFERMDRVREPARRAAGILFADLEASGALSRRLSSRGYFDLIRAVTDLIDRAVIARDGIVGKHAGDGGRASLRAYPEPCGSFSFAMRRRLRATPTSCGR